MESLNHVLGNLHHRYQNRQPLQQVLDRWDEVVGTIVAQQTRPISLQRGVLKVATSSAAWAQNLVFERQRLIQKVNSILAQPIADIRFSAADWQEPQAQFPGEAAQQQLWQEHPSRLKESPKAAAAPELPEDPLLAFQRWATTIQVRSRHLPICPQCQCPTPPGEIDRWGRCGFCAAQTWESNLDR